MSRDSFADAEARLASLRLRLTHLGVGSKLANAQRRLTARPRPKLPLPSRPASEQAPDEQGQFTIRHAPRGDDNVLRNPFRKEHDRRANSHRVTIGGRSDANRPQPRSENASIVRLNLSDGSTRTGRALSGEWLRSRREAAGLTAADLADRARLPAELIERAEADDPAFDAEPIRAQLEAALGDRA